MNWPLSFRRMTTTAATVTPLSNPPVGLPLEQKGLEVSYTFERERHNEYTFGITRASGAHCGVGIHHSQRRRTRWTASQR